MKTFISTAALCGMALLLLSGCSSSATYTLQIDPDGQYVIQMAVPGGTTYTLQMDPDGQHASVVEQMEGASVLVNGKHVGKIDDGAVSISKLPELPEGQADLDIKIVKDGYEWKIAFDDGNRTRGKLESVANPPEPESAPLSIGDMAVSFKTVLKNASRCYPCAIFPLALIVLLFILGFWFIIWQIRRS